MDSNTFTGTVDRYNGVTVDSKEEPCDMASFPDKLNGEINKVLTF